LLADGRVLVVGGYDGVYLASAELYDPATGAWTAADSLAIGLSSHSATLLADGRVLLTGGHSLDVLKNAQIYDPLNVIRNASFESAGVDPGEGHSFLPGDSTAITHWTVGGAGIDYLGGAWPPAEGRRSLDLNGPGSGSIRQVMDTSRWPRYLVTFSLAGNPDGGPAVKSLRVYAGSQFQDFTFDITGKSKANMGWTVKSWTFLASAASTTLEFRSLTSGPYGPLLDKVRVIRAPAPPPTLLLLD